MIDKRIKLDVLHDDNGSFVDLSNNAADYLRDQLNIEMIAAEDHLYIGFTKPINAVYVEVSAENTTGSVSTLEAHNGTSWAAIEAQDETKGFSRSGFITWERTDMTSTEVDGVTQYWVRIAVDIDTAAMVLDGINLVFSDDQMLKREFTNILDPRILGTGQTTHIIQHVASRNLIVQMLRNDGYIKYNNESGAENITQWDLLDIYEIREAATYMALSKIFFLLSDDTEDNWWQKHKEYEKLFKKTFATAKLSIDTSDDGVEDAGEKLAQRKSLTWDR